MGYGNAARAELRRRGDATGEDGPLLGQTSLGGDLRPAVSFSVIGVPAGGQSGGEGRGLRRGEGRERSTSSRKVRDLGVQHAASTGSEAAGEAHVEAVGDGVKVFGNWLAERWGGECAGVIIAFRKDGGGCGGGSRGDVSRAAPAMRMGDSGGGGGALATTGVAEDEDDGGGVDVSVGEYRKKLWCNARSSAA